MNVWKMNNASRSCVEASGMVVKGDEELRVVSDSKNFDKIREIERYLDDIYESCFVRNHIAFNEKESVAFDFDEGHKRQYDAEGIRKKQLQDVTQSNQQLQMLYSKLEERLEEHKVDCQKQFYRINFDLGKMLPNNKDTIDNTVTQKDKENDDLKTKCSSLNEQLLWYEKNHKLQQRQIKLLEDTLRKGNKERNELQLSMKEMGKQKERDDQEISLLRNDINKSKSLEEDREAQLKELEEENRRLRKSLAAFRKTKDIKQKIFEIDEKCIELEESVKIVQNENISLTNELIRMKSRLSDVQKESQVKECYLNDLEIECKQLLEDKNTLLDVNEGMEEEMAGYKELLADFDDLMQKNRRKIVEIKEYKAEVERLKENERENMQHLTTLIKEGKTLGDEVARLEQEKLELQTEIDQVQINNRKIPPGIIKEREKYFHGVLTDIKVTLEHESQIDTLDVADLVDEIKSDIVSQKMRINEQDNGLQEMKKDLEKLRNDLHLASQQGKELNNDEMESDAKIYKLQVDVDELSKQSGVNNELEYERQQLELKCIQQEKGICAKETEEKITSVNEEREVAGATHDDPRDEVIGNSAPEGENEADTSWERDDMIKSSDDSVVNIGSDISGNRICNQLDSPAFPKEEPFQKVIPPQSTLITPKINIQSWPSTNKKSLVTEETLCKEITEEQKKPAYIRDSDEDKDLVFNNDDIDNLLNLLL